MHVNNACMLNAPYASIVVWKSQNGAKTLVNLGAGKKLTCFLTRYGRVAVIFLCFFWQLLVQHTIPTTYNSQKNNFNEIILFQNSPVQPLALVMDSKRKWRPSQQKSWQSHDSNDKRERRMMEWGYLDNGACVGCNNQILMGAVKASRCWQWKQEDSTVTGDGWWKGVMGGDDRVNDCTMMLGADKSRQQQRSRGGATTPNEMAAPINHQHSGWV